VIGFSCAVYKLAYLLIYLLTYLLPAVGITDKPPPCARDHQAVVFSCSLLARRWVALERRSAWLVVDTQVKAGSRETHSPSRASKTYGHNAFQIIHIHTTVINSGRTHTTQHRTHCGLRLQLQSWLMPQSPYRLRNDLKCVEWDVKPCSIQSTCLLRMTCAVPLYVEFPSCRVVFTALAFFGFLNIYCLRVNLSVALVAMVNRTEEYKNVTENETDNCGNLIEPKDLNATHEVSSSSSSSSSSSRNEYYLGGIIALLLQDHRTISTKSVCSSQYMVTDQH